jgi:putative endonuclease
MYYTYILYSQKADSFYKGQTSDVHKRLLRHNNGYEKSTKDSVPWVLLWYTEKNSRSEALKLESKLKNLSRARTIHFMLKYKEGIVGNQIDFINGFET